MTTPSGGTKGKLTPLGTIVSLLLVGGLIALGVYLVKPELFSQLFGRGGSDQTQASGGGTGAETRPADAERPRANTSDRPAAPQRNVLARVKRAGTLRVGMEPEAPPMNFKNGQGQRDGLDFQIAFELAGKLGVNRVQVVEADYGDLPGLLGRGEIDVIMGGYVADPAVLGVDWSEGYLDFGLCLIVKQGSAVREPRHLTGRTVGIYADPAARDWVTANVRGVRDIKEFEYTGWFAELDKGNVDAIVYDYPFAVEEIKAFPRLRIVALNLNESEYAIGVPSNNDDLLDAINAGLGEITASEAFEGWVRTYLRSGAIDVAELPRGSKTYVVKAGDTLSKIAAAQLGRADAWPSIWALNKTRVPNPHLIDIGFALLMP